MSVGAGLAERGIGVVYGGGRLGLMGALADAALAAGGQVVGVIPRSLVDRELAHPGLTELRVVGSLHERKAQMADLADGFVALPGGLGTHEELAEVASWAQLERHTKPIALLARFDAWQAPPDRWGGCCRPPEAGDLPRPCPRRLQAVRPMIGPFRSRPGREPVASVRSPRSRPSQKTPASRGAADQHSQASPQPARPLGADRRRVVQRRAPGAAR